jgi:hypothetical protein
MELLGEEVDTKVAVLAGGSRGRDADDLAGAALEDEDVTKADVVAGDGDSVGTGLGLGGRAGNLSAGVSVLVVVTHFGFGAGRNGGGRVGGAGLNGVLDDLYVLADDGASGNDGKVVGVGVSLLGGRVLDGEADSEIADVGMGLLN